jgi:hypothetical protein
MTTATHNLIAAIERPEGYDAFDPPTWPTYDPAVHREVVLALADEMGEDGEARYEGSGFDWERFTDKMEAYLHINFPTTWDDPLYSAIKRVARKAWKEAGE